jgi:hypothetical protein
VDDNEFADRTTDFHRLLSAIAANWGAPQESLTEMLVHRDDWVAVLMMFNLVELSLDFALAARMPRPLEDVVVDLPLSHKAGKLRFARALKLLTDEQANFLRTLTNLRNHYAHNIKFLKIPIATYLDSLSQNDRKTFLSTAQACVRTIPKDHEVEPRLLVAVASLNIIMSLTEFAHRDLALKALGEPSPTTPA